MEQPLHVAGRLLRNQRDLAEMTQRDLADAMGVSHAFIGEVERGIRPLPPARCDQLAEVLGNIRPGVLLAAVELDAGAEVNSRAQGMLKRLRVAMAGARYGQPLEQPEIEMLVGLL